MSEWFEFELNLLQLKTVQLYDINRGRETFAEFMIYYIILNLQLIIKHISIYQKLPPQHSLKPNPKISKLNYSRARVKF